MSAKALAIGALFSHRQLGRDLHFDGEVVWAASAGGVEVFDSDGRTLARLDDLPSRDATAFSPLAVDDHAAYSIAGKTIPV